VKKHKVVVLGATGYTALEVLEILLRHPHAEVVAATSRNEDPTSLANLHPRLMGRIDLQTEVFDVAGLKAKGIETAFSCLPHGASASSVSALLKAGIKVIDLSADYRLKTKDDQQKWYGHAHADPENLPLAVYGLPEFHADKISRSKLVANPGCYPQTVILGLAPLVRNKLIKTGTIIADCKSGVSGAGRTPSLKTHFPECNESVSAYQLGVHRHTAEMEQELGGLIGESVPVLFLPHLIPMERGILSTISAELVSEINDHELIDIYRKEFEGQPFVRICHSPPSTSQTRHTNFLDIHPLRIGHRVVVVASLDNLIRGASGVAVQNFNLMNGWPQTTALLP
jgi:N-acetyl-gamma-glutamyl-phosphate reductase